MDSRRARLLLPALVVAGAVLLPVPAYAAGDPLVNFGNQALSFLTHDLGPIVLGLGLVASFICVILGSRDGVQKAIYAVVGGALLYGLDTVMAFIKRNG